MVRSRDHPKQRRNYPNAPTQWLLRASHLGKAMPAGGDGGAVLSAALGLHHPREVAMACTA
jgi:hypothetical protein